MRKKAGKQAHDSADVGDKAKIAKAITAAITARGLTQTQAGALLNLSQGDVSNLKNGKFLGRFTFDRLLDVARKIGIDVQITLAPGRSTTGKLSVSS